jgi:hypothetical protein
MLGKRAILQDSMIMQDVDATLSLPEKNKKKYSNILKNILKI